MTPNSLPLYFEPIPTESIQLGSAALAQAIALSQAIPDPLQCWQSYLTLLALEGFEEWLQQHSTPTPLKRKQATLQPNGFDLPAASRLDLSRFQVCLVAIDSDEDEVVELPASVMDAPGEMAHFYVAAAVNEELHLVTMRYFLRYDTLAQYRQQNRCPVTSNRTYQLPTTIFETDFDELLLVPNLPRSQRHCITRSSATRSKSSYASKSVVSSACSECRCMATASDR